VEHRKWQEMLKSMSTGGATRGAGVSPLMLARVLDRAALAGGPVPRSAISKGSMLLRPETLASGTVIKAVDALIREGLLAEEGSQKSGQPGPPITPLRLSDKWAIMGIHIDQQHEGPDGLAGIICGLDRKPLTELVKGTVPRKGGRRDVLDLAEQIRKLAEELLAQLDSPRRFLGVGVEIGGHVHHGDVQDSVHAGWSKHVDLQKILTEELGQIDDLDGVPAVAENDVNALAIHGYYEKSFRGLDVALVTVFRQGTGGALILNGRMYRGVGSMAPEPGHLAVEYPEDDPLWTAPPRPDTVAGRTFGDECLCSTKDRKAYGHVDTLAVPARIEAQLATLKKGEKTSLEEAAAAPLAVPSGGSLVFTDEAVVMRRAGRALGRALAHVINTVNPGQIVLLLPEALAKPAPQTSGTEYLDAVEREANGAYSTGPADARGGHLRLTVHSYANDEQVFLEGATAAATTAFNAFIEHARGRDGCDPADDPGRHGPPVHDQDQADRDSRRAASDEQRELL
jgi:predicted NBD/HSP70 family sugar kinase